MLKLHSCRLLLLVVFFLNSSSNVLCSFYNNNSNNTLPYVVPPAPWQAVINERTTPVQSVPNVFPSIDVPPTSNVGIFPLFPLNRSITPQPYNYSFNNSSPDTFISPFMPSGWDPNNSTNTFNSLPIAHESGACSTTFANTPPLFIPDASISSMAANTNNNIFLPHTQQEAVADVLAEKEKHTTVHICSMCNKNLGSPGALKYHLKTHDPKRPRPYQCHLCDKSFAEKGILKVHIKRHKKEKLFLCDFCKKGFTTKYEKTMHELTHTKEKPYKCTFCDKCFASQRNLQPHIRSHTGEKPFKCHICQKGISSKIALEEHLNKHKGKKPYKCSLCTKAYTTRNGLAYHTKVHNRPKPYTCSYCDAAFVHKSEYENHIRYEEEEGEDRKCHICKKMYADKACLQRHNKKAHPEK